MCPLQILVANDKACSLLGYSSHDLIGQKLAQFFLKSDSEVVEALSEEHVEADGHAAVVFGTVVSEWEGSGGGGEDALPLFKARVACKGKGSIPASLLTLSFVLLCGWQHLQLWHLQ